MLQKLRKGIGMSQRVKRNAATAALNQKNVNSSSTSSDTNTMKDIANRAANRAANLSRIHNNGGRINKKYRYDDNERYDEQGNIIPTIPRHSRTNSVASVEMNSNEVAESAQIQIQQKENSAIKPVLVNSNYKVVMATVKNIKFSEQPKLKILSNNTKIQVSCTNIEDKKKLIENLKDKQFRFFTYTEPTAKPIIYVLKGFYADTTDEALKQIIEAKIPATKVTLINQNNKDAPTFLVQFDRASSTSLKLLQLTHRYIENCSVRWEYFDRANKRLTQCRNCQLYGHAASNCNMGYRCVKCDMSTSHEPGQCPRQNREEGTPKCCNCGGEHTANSPNCPHHITYRQRVEKKRYNRRAAEHFVDNIVLAPAPRNHRQLQQPAQDRLINQRQGSSTAASWAAMAAAPAYSSQFPSLPSQRQGQQNVSTTLNGFEYMRKIVTNIQNNLAAVTTIFEELRAFEAFTADLRSAGSESDRRQIMLNFFLSNQNVS